MKWREQADLAVNLLANLLGPRGQWPGWVCSEALYEAGRKDISAPLTALGILALRDLPLAGVDDLVRRSREHIELTVQPGGLWRYYANIPPDTDDSAMCALALGLDHPLVAGRSTLSLAALRGADGRFPTWFEPGWNPVIDPVANTHVVAVIGGGPQTAAAIAWLLDVVATGRERAKSSYYPDPLDLHVALVRALEAGVTALRPAVEIAAVRAQERLGTGGLSPYRIAQAMVVASTAVQPDRPLLKQAAATLAAGADPAGGWPAETLFVCRTGTAGGLLHYQSRAVVTALCLRALVLSETIERN